MLTLIMYVLSIGWEPGIPKSKSSSRFFGSVVVAIVIFAVIVMVAVAVAVAVVIGVVVVVSRCFFVSFVPQKVYR